MKKGFILFTVYRLLALGKAGLEPARFTAHDPKSCSSAYSDTSPVAAIIRQITAEANVDSVLKYVGKIGEARI